MRKLGIIAVLSLMLVALSAAVASAANPHFLNASATTDKSGNLVVTFKEAGLGTTSPTEQISVNADATAEYGCFNRGGNHPEAANKETVSGPVSGSGTFPVRNGQTTGSITVAPPDAGDFSCPKGQDLRLISVTYSNITITGAAGTISTSPDTVSFP